MIPSDFDYAAPETLDAAVGLLAGGGPEAKVLAGGHSLLPLMKLRLAAPSLLIDLRRIPRLTGIDRGDGLRIGAMTCHAEVAGDRSLGLLSRVASTIADPQVRHRGTIGGSLAHGHPAADLPAVLLAAEGSVVVRGPDGEREIPAAELFRGYMQTSVAAEEIVREVRVPSLDGWGFAYEKFNRRAEDWAMVAVCVLVHAAPDGTCQDVRIGLTNMSVKPLRASAAEDALRGRPLDAASIAAAAELAGEGTDPLGDLNATPDYKRHLARVLCRRALTQAAAAPPA